MGLAHTLTVSLKSQRLFTRVWTLNENCNTCFTLTAYSAYRMELQREMNVEQGFPQEKISVLILTSHWHADTYGMASLTRCLVNDLRFADPEGVKINITCALLEEERKISENDIDAAAKHNVNLRGAKRPRGDNNNKEPNIKWLDKYSVTYYFHIFQEEKYDFLIGHVPYLANGICNLKEFSNSSGQLPKVVFFVHALPKHKKVRWTGKF